MPARRLLHPSADGACFRTPLAGATPLRAPPAAPQPPRAARDRRPRRVPVACRAHARQWPRARLPDSQLPRGQPRGRRVPWACWDERSGHCGRHGGRSPSVACPRVGQITELFLRSDEIVRGVCVIVCSCDTNRVPWRLISIRCSPLPPPALTLSLDARAAEPHRSPHAHRLERGRSSCQLPKPLLRPAIGVLCWSIPSELKAGRALSRSWE